MLKGRAGLGGHDRDGLGGHDSPIRRLRVGSGEKSKLEVALWQQAMLPGCQQPPESESAQSNGSIKAAQAGPTLAGSMLA
jgi:hypothetical protein